MRRNRRRFRTSINSLLCGINGPKLGDFGGGDGAAVVGEDYVGGVSHLAGDVVFVFFEGVEVAAEAVAEDVVGDGDFGERGEFFDGGVIGVLAFALIDFAFGSFFAGEG